MNPVLPVLAGTLPVTTIVLMIMMQWNRTERRKAAVSQHIAKALKNTLQPGAGGGIGAASSRPKLVFERTGTAYRGRMLDHGGLS
jgi:hypothetical protein